MSDKITFVSGENATTFASTENETTFVQVGVQGPAGPSVHSGLTGLSSDDHPQYLNNARGDVRYPAETASTVGALIAGAIAKPVPIDADSLGLSDSAESNILKKFTWASLKSALNGIFARLSGITGGQTLIGGTGAGDALTLQGTSASGTTGTDAAFRLLVGDNGVTEALNITNESAVRVCGGAISVDSTKNVAFGTSATPGSNHNAKFTSGPLYSSNITVSTATPGNNRNAGFISDFQVVQTGTRTLNQYGGLIGFTIPDSNTYDITASNCYGVQVYSYLGGSGRVNQLRNLSGIVEVNLTSGVAASSYLGVDAQVNTSAGNTTTINYASGFQGTISHLSLSSTIVVARGCAGEIKNYGNSAGAGGTITGAAPVSAHINVKSGCTITNAYGVSIGGSVGDGWTNNGTITNAYAIYIGSSTNIGTNKWSIYNASPATSYFVGSIAIGWTAASAKVHVFSTTEQLRLAYDAANYASFTVSSAGVLTITTTGTAPALLLSGDIRFDKTITAAGTTGAQTINKTMGSVNFAAGATSLVVTNNKVSTSSVIVATVAVNDTTMKSVAAVAAAGSFTLSANAAATAETRVNFHVFN